MTVEIFEQIPEGLRRVPILTEPSIGHYPEFRNFLKKVFDLEQNNFKAPCVLRVNQYLYEFIFHWEIGRRISAALKLMPFRRIGAIGCRANRQGPVGDT